MSGSKALGVRDIVLMNVVAILSIRQLSTVAPYGAASVLLWVIAAVGLFIPLSMVCGELSTGWPEAGGIFVWVRAAFGPRIGWLCVFFFLCSCIFFFPMLLQFLVTTLVFCFDESLALNKVFVGLCSMGIFWGLTWVNIRGIEWTRKINNMGALCGVIVPGIILISLAVYWVATGHPVQTDYHTPANWVPRLNNWSTIVFVSSMMFAFAGMELSPMIAGRCKNPQKDFPLSILISSIVIVGIYMLGTVSLNILLPANDADIVAGLMQGIKATSMTLGMPWLLPLMGITIVLGVLGQINSWLVGPIYMLNVANAELQVIGAGITQLHPRYNTPAQALMGQAVLVSIFCLSTFLSKSMAAAYWTLSALTTLCYFIPYLMMFAGFLRLRIKYPDQKRSFRIPGRVLPVLLPSVGFISVLFAVVLLFVPPQEVDMGSLVVYELQIGGGGVLFALVGDMLYRRAVKKKAGPFPKRRSQASAALQKK